jgi:hypothetical protein
MNRERGTRRPIETRHFPLVAILMTSACADDFAIGPADSGVDARDGSGQARFDKPVAPDVIDGIGARDLGPTPSEPPLTVQVCPLPGGGTCCASALGFEDASSGHFLTPASGLLALSNPQVTSNPTACGRGALSLDADFRATTAASLCGQIDEALECSHLIGEVSRGILTPLDLTGLTASAMVYVDGPPLPAGQVQGTLFILGGGGYLHGPSSTIQLHVWTRLDLTIADDGHAPGADVHLIGIRIDLQNQSWLGQVYIDEITWH